MDKIQMLNNQDITTLGQSSKNSYDRAAKFCIFGSATAIITSIDVSNIINPNIFRSII